MSLPSILIHNSYSGIKVWPWEWPIVSIVLPYATGFCAILVYLQTLNVGGNVGLPKINKVVLSLPNRKWVILDFVCIHFVRKFGPIYWPIL